MFVVHSCYFNSRWQQQPRPPESFSIPALKAFKYLLALCSHSIFNTDKFWTLLKVPCDDTFCVVSSAQGRKDYRAQERMLLWLRKWGMGRGQQKPGKRK